MIVYFDNFLTQNSSIYPIFKVQLTKFKERGPYPLSQWTEILMPTRITLASTVTLNRLELNGVNCPNRALTYINPYLMARITLDEEMIVIEKQYYGLIDSVSFLGGAINFGFLIA